MKRARDTSVALLFVFYHRGIFLSLYKLKCSFTAIIGQSADDSLIHEYRYEPRDQG